jgi:uncharacterized membrane protein YjfL (UPF0719 family)
MIVIPPEENDDKAVDYAIAHRSETRREILTHLHTLLAKCLQQSQEIDRSLLTLSGGALLLSITFIGTLSQPRQMTGLLFVAWGCFIAAIVAVIFAMKKAYETSHATAANTADNLERYSQMDVVTAYGHRATFPVGQDRGVAWLNQIAIWGFVAGVVSLCAFVGLNLKVEHKVVKDQSQALPPIVFPLPQPTPTSSKP